ncbi:MAG: ABC transporter permease [Chloroflexi bacterium]|nr:ABC transporter permease [Chloroflexota bacterium]
MIGDIGTMLWKEFKEILLQRGSWRSGWLSLLITVGVFGVFLPLQSGRAWLENPLLLVVWLWVPLFLVTSVVADSFAGERERHTLETLLASRLSDRAILLGKVLASILYGWGITMVMLALGVLTVNVAHGAREFIFYPLPVAVAIVVMAFLVATLVACVGVLVSLRTTSVRQAVQTMSLALMALFLLPSIALQAAPRSVQAGVVQFAQSLDFGSLVVVVAVALVALDAGILAFNLGRFKRNRLILD